MPVTKVERDYQWVIHNMKYSRLKPDGTREDWGDNVERFSRFMQLAVPMPPEALKYFRDEVVPMIKDKKVVPSMRLMASAGPAAGRENLTAFNCMFLGIDSIAAFGRLLYALMCGTGVGFSVERRYIEKLPPLPRCLKGSSKSPIVVRDSREGWTEAFIIFLEALWAGEVRQFDTSLVRPAGAPLHVTGGYASGPEPLELLHGFVVKEFARGAPHDCIRDITVFDICCKIADVVVQGGVRRSACICLFDSFSSDMWDAKHPQNLKVAPWRYNANVSVVFEIEAQVKANMVPLLDRARVNGEPGIMVKSTLMKKLKTLGREPGGDENIGLNPCGEVILRSNQVCNLTEVILRPEFTLEDNMNQVEAAVFLGLLQSCLLKYNPLFTQTSVLGETERLLGVSLTGIMDDPELLKGPHALCWLREHAHLEAERWSKILRIPCPKAITTVKPSGTVSKLMSCSAGIHPRFSKYYLSNISVAKGSPLDKFLIDQVPLRASLETANVYSFPLAAPAGAITADDIDAIEQLGLWALVSRHWCDHNVSCTVYVGSNEWESVGSWCSENAALLGGITFLPKFEGEPSSYPYMPLEPLSEEEFFKRLQEWKPLVYQKFAGFDDFRDQRSQEFACTGGGCEII